MKHDIGNALIEIECQAEADPPTATAQFCFATELPIFAGHFPGFPLVPGIYLVETARTTAEQLLDRRLEIARVLDARFTAEVLPDAVITTEIRLLAEDAGWCCEVNIRTAEAKAARMRLLLR